MEKELIEIGLSEAEARAYTELLRIGSSKVNELAIRLGLPRTTVYNILNSLVRKGVVSYVLKSGIKYFEAADPDKLLRIQEEKTAGLRSVLPEFEKIRQSIGKRPSVELYEGKEGLKTILDDIIKTRPKELLTLSSAKILEALEFYFPNWIKRRVENGIYARVIQEKVKAIKEMRLIDKSQLREIRFLPKGMKINTHTQIYHNKVAILTLRKENLIGVVVENEDITETQRQTFEQLWRLAK